MNYISTRDNHEPVSSAAAINFGMVPGGGLFVPQSLPHVDASAAADETYHQTAFRVLRPLLSDYSDQELTECIQSAYNEQTFDTPSVVRLADIGRNRHVLELWHGPTAAFKDVALQIMPHLLRIAKNKLNKTNHTVILVATSGDTGKAALEGFKDCEGISIIVFFPDGGVSPIQKLQMVTTTGNNTHVVGVRGNFDDCQTGVKEIFGTAELGRQLKERNLEFSSANSINWGRLSPQIVYYFRAYGRLLSAGSITPGSPVDFCVPTGNFGNILAGYYAQRMGVPIRRLICASNKNKILTDFFTTGIYDRNRSFYRTMSPSMDILISSNLERFLYEISGQDGREIIRMYNELSQTGRFSVNGDIKSRMDQTITPCWVDEPQVLETIGKVFRETGYTIDTHTAVAVAAAEEMQDEQVPVVIDSTASPFKFSRDVLKGIHGEYIENEFDSIRRLQEITNVPIHSAVDGLDSMEIRHRRVIDIKEMKQAVLDSLT
ncbi:MAG: threonine synthase [Chitinivibrionales bacterium]